MSEITIKLPAELTIVQAEEFKSEIITAVDKVDTITFDDSDINRIDTLGIQLLLASVIHISSQNKTLNWQCESQIIRASVTSLGINEPILNQYLEQ